MTKESNVENSRINM